MELTAPARAHPVLPGVAQGPVLRLAAPISFWGGIDPATGRITDTAQRQTGHSIARQVLMIPQCRGSSSSSAVLLELLHNGHAPAALVLGEIDAILGLGILVAAEMGWPTIPLLLLPPGDQQRFADGQTVTIDPTGLLNPDP